jgi:hypothetical protein
VIKIGFAVVAIKIIVKIARGISQAKDVAKWNIKNRCKLAVIESDGR